MDKPQIVKSSELKGLTVKNFYGDVIGEVNELVVNKITGKIAYLVLQFGGFMGFGNKYFAFPWTYFNYSSFENHFILNVDFELLEKTTGFDKNQWPNFEETELEPSLYEAGQ